MPARVIVDDGVSSPKREKVFDLVSSVLGRREDADNLIAVVTKLPSGRMTVFINHVADPAFVATLEKAIANLD